MSSTISLESTVGLYSAIVSTLFVPGTPTIGQIEVLTSLQYPWIINTTAPMNIISSPPGLTPSIVTLTENCQPGVQCIQTFRINIGVAGACRFTGAYTVAFKVACTNSICENQDSTFTLTIDSEDFCATTTIDIGLTGSMASYSDSSYAVTKTLFSFGQNAYFKLLATSSQVSLVGSRIQRVQWEQGATTKLLYSDYLITGDGVTEGFTLGPNTTNSATFYFGLDPAWMPVPLETTRTFNVSAIISVTYSNALGDFSSDVEYKLQYETQPLPDGVQSGNQATKSYSHISILATEGAQSGSSLLVVSISVIICAILIFIQ